MKEKTGIFTKCEWCDKEIYQTQTQYNRAKHHFCSNQCQKLWLHNEAYEDRACEICGSVFNVSKKSSQRFCCDNCQHQWQRTRIGFDNPRFTGVEVECNWCGKKYPIPKYKLDLNEHHFCSVNCRRQWYSYIFSQDEEWKEKSRQRAVDILNSHSNITLTLPQKIVNGVLDDMGIKYENEKGFVYYSVDNYLTDYNLIIEVMGDYWHANPNKYDIDNINDMQKDNIRRDKAKKTYIEKYYNIHILYLWETDILNNINECKELILNYINNNTTIYNSYEYIRIRRDCNTKLETVLVSLSNEDTVRTLDMT